MLIQIKKELSKLECSLVTDKPDVKNLNYQNPQEYIQF